MSVTAYSVGICYASVCTDESDEAATAALNASHPTGVGPWAISSAPFTDGQPNPAECNTEAGCRHILFSC